MEAPMTTTADLYEKDFVRWAEEQAKALRLAAETRPNLPIDWENLAEEVEGLGASYRRELATRIGAIIEHLLKLEHSPAIGPRRGWIETVLRERTDVHALLEESPSLRRKLPDIVAAELNRRKKLTVSLLSQYDESDPAVREAVAAAEYTTDQVLGDWLPGAPGERH
jgi:Domain of unknown function DUF29